MRRIAVINQKGGVGKTTTSANLGAALAQQGRRVVLIDMDAQANLSISLGTELASDSPSTYTVLLGESTIAQALRPTAIEGLSLIASNIDLSGAELELAGAIGREHLMRDALAQWESEHRKAQGRSPADYVIFDCPPSLGLLSINALAAAGEVLITLQTEFLALQGMTKLVGVVQLLRRRVNPELVITGILPCLYDSRLKLAREVLGEIRRYFGAQVFPHPVRTNVKLAEAPSFGKTIFEYAPDSNGAQDYLLVAREVMLREGRDADLAGLPPYREGRAAHLELGAHAPSDAALAMIPAAISFQPPASVTPTSGVEPTVDVESPAKVRTKSKSAAGAEPTAASEPSAKVRPRADIEPTPAVKTPVAAKSKSVAEPLARAAPSGIETRKVSAAAPRVETKRGGAEQAAVNGLTQARPATPVPSAAPTARKSGKRAEPAEQTTTSSTCARAAVAAPNVPHGPAPSRRKQREPEPKPSVPEAAPRAAEEKLPGRGARAKAASEVTITPAAREPLRRIVRAEDLPPLPPDAFEILTNYVRDA
jgi:chromosome partitioning protein